MVVEANTRVWEEEGPSIGLKEVLPNCQTTQEGGAGPGPRCSQQERRTEELLNLTAMSSAEEAESEDLRQGLPVSLAEVTEEAKNSSVAR